MKKIAVVFPGIGYHTDKPLLYYGKKLAKEDGYEVIEISYGGFPGNIKGDKEKMKAAFQAAFMQTQALLSKVDLAVYESVLFISKSIGTAVAAAYAGKYEIPAKHIYFTPVEESLPFMQGNDGIVFHGTADPWADTAILKEYCSEHGMPLYLTEGANHSMETGDVERDLKELTKIIVQCGAFLEDLL